jgi:hypothetical protein
VKNRAKKIAEANTSPINRNPSIRKNPVRVSSRITKGEMFLIIPSQFY